MRISYYPGCSLQGTAVEYDQSLKAVAEKLGIELVELPDWNCCGASSAHALDFMLAKNLAARNLAMAERQSMDLLVPCAACYNRLQTAQEEERERGQTNYDFQILNILELLNREEITKKIVSLIKNPLRGLKVVPYYGCLLVRPPRVTGAKNFENPKEMDYLLKLMGAEVIPWSYKTDCCGGSLILTAKAFVFRLVERILAQALAAGAEAIAVACPLCHANLDTRQKEIAQGAGAEYEIPIFYISELIGLAFGDKDSRKWWKKHFINPAKIIEKRAVL
ncbi:MAG: CoB--CoM heterodisulfide reductase iron-sulfur subunit B family protein [Thermodesulfobacteriota bacterium]